MKICLYGSASENIDEKFKTAVYELSKRLAESGHTLVYGGGCLGLMGAAARGTKAGGGSVYGVYPEFFLHTEVKCIFDDCDKVYPCNTMYERKSIMEDISDAFLVVPGGIGTFDEFFGVLATKQLGRHSKPIAVFNVDGFFNPLEDLIKSAHEKGFVGNYKDYYILSSDTNELVEYFLKNSK